MKRLTLIITLSLITAFAHAQFKGLGKKIEKKVNNRIERKIDRTIDKGLDKTEEGIDDATRIEKGKEGNNGPEANGEGNADGAPADAAPEIASDSFVASTKFDFVPGEKLLVTDNFASDNLGDFPAKWDGNGSGEVVMVGNSGEKWFQLFPGTIYIPDVPGNLPEEFTIEFDVATTGLSNQTSSQARLAVQLDDNGGFRDGMSLAVSSIPFSQYIDADIQVHNRKEGANVINNRIDTDLRKIVLNQPHVSIAVNKMRYRMWINEVKYIDVPRLVPAGMTHVKFELKGIDNNKEQIYITNVKIAEGGLDLRSQLLTEGRVSTNGILFDTNSANVRPESYGVIREIAQAMQSSGGINVKVVGHTDSDGNDQNNLQLSKSRAESVKQILVKDFNIAATRLTVDGKGESEPVTDNSTPEKKAENRRVEFIVL